MQNNIKMLVQICMKCTLTGRLRQYTQPDQTGWPGPVDWAEKYDVVAQRPVLIVIV